MNTNINTRQKEKTIMKYTFYAIHHYINVNGRRIYVTTVNGDRLVIDGSNAFHNAGWFLYAGDILVCCGEVSTLHGESHSSDLDYNSYVFNYTEKR